MDSHGYTRLLILQLMFSALCLQWVRTQGLMDPSADAAPGAKSQEEEAWDAEQFNEEADQNYNLVFLKYNHRIRPPAYNVEVDLAATLTHVRHLDVGRQELQTVLDLDMSWMDSRLNWRPDLVKEIHESADRVWCPDIIYLNGVSPVQHLYPKILRIIHNGTVSWKRKEIVTTRCDTQPSSSNQSCAIKIGFLTNGPGRDTFFFSADSTVKIDSDAEVFSHKWQLASLEMNVGHENETKSTTIDLDLGFEHVKRGGGQHGMGTGGTSDSSHYTQHTTDTNYVLQDGGASKQSGSGCGCTGNGNSPGAGGSIHSNSIRHISELTVTWSLFIGTFLVGFLKREMGCCFVR